MVLDPLGIDDPDALAGRLESWDVADDGMTGNARLFNTTIGRDAVKGLKHVSLAAGTTGVGLP